MCEVVEISDDEGSTVPEIHVEPKEEILDFDLPQQNSFPTRAEDNVASSSGSNLRSSFIGMGFSPSLVDKAIEENGEGNAELLLETLFKYSVPRQPKIENFDDGLFNGGNNDLSGNLHVKEEFDSGSGITEEKMTTLLKMNFSLQEIGFSLDRLGKGASIGQITDFIFAARMAKKYEKDTNQPLSENKDSKEDGNNDALFCIMDKTLLLLEMGFSENDISTAFERCGSEASLTVLAESIVTGTVPIVDKMEYQSLKRKMGDYIAQPYESYIIKTEECSLDVVSHEEGTSDLPEKRKGKMPREEHTDELSNWKKPKEEESIEDLCKPVCPSPVRQEVRRGKKPSTRNQAVTLPRQVGFLGSLEEDIKPEMLMHNPGRSLSSAVAKPPYFFYGTITNLSPDSWIKISKFLYSVQPEIVNTRLYSALSRSEGYVHNLPAEDRFHVLPKGPMTIEEAVPNSKKWWPSWDTRRQLSYINCDASGISYVCDRVRKMLVECKGLPSAEQQREILRHCEGKNLVWVGNMQPAALEPEHLEGIMGYPLNHSRIAGIALQERLESLKLTFQTDTLGYHLSVLKPVFPEGVTVLSFFSGIGGAEVALHRLGIKLRGVVSVEPSETKRRILKQWWGKSAQTGDLIQIESINKLSGNKLEELFKKFGGFDIVICQNPCLGGGSEMDSYSLDFSMFVEFVRVLQRVRSSMGRKR